MREHLRPFLKLRVRLLGIQARTSLGRIAGGRVGKELRHEMIKSLR